MSVEKLKENISKLKSIEASLHNQIQEKNKELANAKLSATKANKECSQVFAKLETREKALDENLEEIKKKSFNFEELSVLDQENIDLLKAKNQEMEAERQSKLQLCESKNAEKNASIAKCQEIYSELTHLEEKHSLLEGKLDFQKKEIDELTREIQEVQYIHDRVQTKANRKREFIEKMESEISRLTTLLEQTTEKTTNLDHVNATKSFKLNEIFEELSEMQEKSSAAQLEMNDAYIEA
ncbi:hypothetical protein Ciccas_005544 [Cichlidogyrus casuarinus]|uniref:Uncharacterized protein n=1 Tax=Cichlidogyrus casuarinus TaxID=1844966 RepID=A0ABD2Q8C8_9PLAT